MSVPGMMAILGGGLGLLIGSFLTVVVDRVPERRSLGRPPSCAACDQQLSVPDLVPVASWLISGGKCRHCGVKIGVEPLAIEIATAMLFVAFALRFGVDLAVVGCWVLAAALVALVAIDLRLFRLPREISYIAFLISTVILAADALIDATWDRFIDALFGALLATAIMGAIYMASRASLGDGDVRLAPLLGLHLGYVGVELVPVGLSLSFLAGAVVGVAAIATGKANRKTPIPFGPFLAVGTITAIFVGSEMVNLMWPA